MQVVVDILNGAVVIGLPIGSASGTKVAENVLLWRGAGLNNQNRYSVEVKYPGFRVTICNDELVANLRVHPAEEWYAYVLAITVPHLSGNQWLDLMSRVGSQEYRRGWQEGVRSLQSQLRELLTEDIETPDRRIAAG